VEDLKLSLISYERDLFEFIDKELAVDRALLMGFAVTLDCLRRLFQDLLTETLDEMRAGCVVVMGLLNHTHHLLIGGLQGPRDGNSAVWSLCARSLMETFGACVLTSERPETAPNYLALGSKAGKLRAAAERAQPGLANDISRLNEIVHPGSRAILFGFQMVNVEQRTAGLQYGLRRPSLAEAKEAVTVLENLATLIGNKLKLLSRMPIVLEAGKVVGRKSAIQ
jgi:hypothetical protein